MSKNHKQFAMTVTTDVAAILDPLRAERRISEYVTDLICYHDDRAAGAIGYLQRHKFGPEHLSCLMDVLNGTIFVDDLPLLMQVQGDMRDTDPETLTKWGIDVDRWKALANDLTVDQARQVKILQEEFWHRKTPRARSLVNDRSQ